MAKFIEILRGWDQKISVSAKLGKYFKELAKKQNSFLFKQHSIVYLSEVFGFDNVTILDTYKNEFQLQIKEKIFPNGEDIFKKI